MRIWKVKVLCEGSGKTSGGRARAYRHWVTCLVEAIDDDAAFAAGVKFAETQAPMGPLWQSFDPREASILHFPAVI